MKDTSSQGVLGGFSSNNNNYSSNENRNSNDASSTSSSNNAFSSSNAQPNNNNSASSLNNGVLNNNSNNNLNINGIGGDDTDLIGSASEFIKGNFGGACLFKLYYGVVYFFFVLNLYRSFVLFFVTYQAKINFKYTLFFD